jgi:amino acid transporter
MHAVDPDGVQGKGLATGSIGLLGSVMMGLAATAPVFSLAATIGFVATAVGTKAPACMLFAFIPMLFVAFAYRELNNVVPDCGTTFTWATKAFGPWVGWMGGWAIAVTGTIFLGNAAEVSGQYFLGLIGQEDLADDTWIGNVGPVTLVGIVFIVAMAYVAYRGVQVAAWMQTVLVILQYIALTLLASAMLYAVYTGNGSEGSLYPEWNWLLPTGLDFSSFIEGVLLCLFIYWGWDAILAINEETKDPEKTPGRAAVLTTIILLVGYVTVTTATVAYAGLGDTGIGLTNPEIEDDVFRAISLPLLGTWGTNFVLLVILLSAAASAQTTILPTARGTLSMAVYKALPSRFATVSPKYMTPSFSTLITCSVGLSFYVMMSIISERVLEDTVLSISLAIAFYYALTAFACVWYFRKELFLSVRSFFFIFFMPMVGGILLTVAFVASAIDMFDPLYGATVDYPEGATYFGVGSVFVIGIGSLLVGVVLMFLWQMKQPAFFRGETLRKDTPVLAPEI